MRPLVEISERERERHEWVFVCVRERARERGMNGYLCVEEKKDYEKEEEKEVVGVVLAI